MSTNCVIYRLQYYFNFCGQFHNARRFGGTLRVTLSPFPAACDVMQRPPKHYPFNALPLWRTSTSDLTLCAQVRRHAPRDAFAMIPHKVSSLRCGTLRGPRSTQANIHLLPPTALKHSSILPSVSFHAKMKAPREVSHEKNYTYITNFFLLILLFTACNDSTSLQQAIDDQQEFIDFIDADGNQWYGFFLRYIIVSPPYIF